MSAPVRKSRERSLRVSLAAGAVAWAAVLLWTPLASGQAGGSVPAYVGSAIVYAAGSLICHQRPERSFTIGGVQMPVCARCIGIYLGAACVAAGFALRRSQPTPPASNVRQILLAGLLPTALTFLYEVVVGLPPSNLVRAVSGAPLGGAVAWTIISFSTSQRAVEIH